MLIRDLIGSFWCYCRDRLSSSLKEIYKYIFEFNILLTEFSLSTKKSYNSSTLPFNLRKNQTLSTLIICGSVRSRESCNISWGLHSHWPQFDFVSSSTGWSVRLGLSSSAGGVIIDFEWHPSKSLILKHMERQLFPLIPWMSRLLQEIRKKSQAGPVLSPLPDTCLQYFFSPKENGGFLAQQFLAYG